MNVIYYYVFIHLQRLAGATLLVFANKQDLPGAVSAEEIRDVIIKYLIQNSQLSYILEYKIKFKFIAFTYLSLNTLSKFLASFPSYFTKKIDVNIG